MLYVGLDMHTKHIALCVTAKAPEVGALRDVRPGGVRVVPRDGRGEPA
jgi:hypothetical protein